MDSLPRLPDTILRISYTLDIAESRVGYSLADPTETMRPLRPNNRIGCGKGLIFAGQPLTDVAVFAYLPILEMSRRKRDVLSAPINPKRRARRDSARRPLLLRSPRTTRWRKQSLIGKDQYIPTYDRYVNSIIQLPKELIFKNELWL